MKQISLLTLGLATSLTAAAQKSPSIVYILTDFVSTCVELTEQAVKQGVREDSFSMLSVMKGTSISNKEAIKPVESKKKMYFPFQLRFQPKFFHLAFQ
jgi:hypothetical protein